MTGSGSLIASVRHPSVPARTMAAMDARNLAAGPRRSRRLDLADPALWAWAVVVVMLAVPAAQTLA